MVTGIIHLVQVDQDELVRVRLQPGHRRSHHLLVRKAIFPRGVETGVHGVLRDQLLEPVITGNCRLQPAAVGSGKQVILGKGGNIRILQIRSRTIVQVWPGADQERGIAGLGIRERAAVHRRPGALLAQPVQVGHHLRLERGVLSQSIDQDENQAPGGSHAGCASRLRGCEAQWRAVGKQRIHQGACP